jgi:NAD(P)-dependent dehydrogenase (short-subunit alcohol dehydrogenase family)
MELKDKIAVVTGGASGIGAALCQRFAREGARHVIVIDRDEAGAEAVAKSCGGVAMRADVSQEADIVAVVERTESELGPIDLFCSNAGILVMDPSHAASTSNEDWDRIWQINVMAHVYAARAVLPHMIARGSGYLINTASAAGLLSQIGSAPYSVTKHAAVGFAEALAIAHGEEGIRVSVLCPQAVQTAMLRNTDGGPAGGDGILDPQDVAGVVVEAIREERFLILPHPEVATYMQRKSSDYDRWIRGMQRFRRNFV